MLSLLGSFTLTGDEGAVQGEAKATLSQQGSGGLQLTSQSGGTDLTSAFQLSQNGNLTLELHGQLPAFTSSPSNAVATPAQATSPKVEESGHFFWHLSRSAGFTAYLLLFVNVCLGLMVRTGWVDRMFARWRSFDLHQFTGLLAMAFVGAHVFSLLGDHFFNFRVGQLFVPLASPYRPLWTGLGVLALYLLIAITGSFYIRRYIGTRMWRTLHYFTFAAFLLVLGHGLLAGTDANTAWARLLYVSTGSAAALLTLWRVMYMPGRQQADEARELATYSRYTRR